MSRLKGELKEKREIKVLKPNWRNFYILRYDNNSDLYNSLRNGSKVLWRKTGQAFERNIQCETL